MFLTTAIGLYIAVVLLAAILLSATPAYKARRANRRAAYFNIESDTQQQFRLDIVARLNKHAKIYQRSPAETGQVTPSARNAKIDVASARTNGSATAPIAGPAST